MNTACTSTYLYLLQFLSSVSSNFLSTDFLQPWLNLFLGILFYFFDAKTWYLKKIVMTVP